jgi:hypothetical protein
MFCPQCGQKQISDGVRFCSSCGFQLEVVTQLLVTNGLPHWQPPMPPPALGPRPPSPRRKGVKQGVTLFGIGILLVPILGILNFPEEIVGLAAVICFLGGILRMLYALFFEESAAKALPQMPVPGYVPPPAPPNYFGARPQDAAALPPAQPQPTPAYRPRRFDTGELVNPPPSVVDHTTRLLDKQKQTDEPPAK